MVHQFVAMLAPLLLSKKLYIIHFIKAVYNFIIIAQYYTHDEETLQYMHHVLYQINILKGVF